LVPELKVLLVFVTESTAVPVADVAAVVDPTIETLYEGFVVPTPTAPEKVDVPVDEVATTFPVINRPYAVVDASVALVDAMRSPILPLKA
jgi:hypothetical protein